MGLTKEQKTMVAVLLAGTLLVVLNQTLLSPALPVIMNDLQVNATTVQWLTSGYALMEAIVIPLSAWFIGRFRTRQLFIGGMALFSVGSLVAALAPSFGFLLLGRVLQASSTGVIMPMVMTLILLIFPRESRGSAMGLVSLVIAFAPAIGPSVSGVLVDSVGWRALFVIVTSLSVLVILFAIKALKDWEGFKRSKFDVPSVVLCAAGMFLFLYGLSTFTSAHNIALTAGLVILGVVIIAIFVRRQSVLEEPLLRLDVLKVRKYRTAVITLCIMMAAMVGLSVLLPLYIQNVLGQSATVSGLVMLPGALVGAVAGFYAGRLFDRYGVRGITLVGAVAMIVAGVGMFFFEIDSTVFLVAAVYTVVIFAIQMIMTPLNTWGVNSLDNSVIQHANAVTNTINQVGGSFGTALIVSLSALGSTAAPSATPLEQTFAGDHIAFSATAGLLFVIFALIVFFVRDGKEGSSAVEKATLRERSPHRIFTAGDIMNPDSARIPVGSSLAQAVHIFSEFQTSGAPIVDHRGHVVGFLSNGDVMKYLGNSDSSYTNAAYSVFGVFEDEDIQRRVAELLKLDAMSIATKKVLSVDPGMSMEQVCTVLADRRIKKLPVVDNGKLVGVISRRNVINAIDDVIPTLVGSSAPESA